MIANLEPGKTALLLADCVSSVFADMAFIDVQETLEENDGSEKTADEKCVAIDVLAPVSCRIEMRISKGLRDRIVENLFGDASDSIQKKNGEDALLEMLNITTGTFLSAYFGAGTEIQLELPQYLYLNGPAQGQIVADVSMTAEGEPLHISLASVRYRY